MRMADMKVCRMFETCSKCAGPLDGYWSYRQGSKWTFTLTLKGRVTEVRLG